MEGRVEGRDGRVGRMKGRGDGRGGRERGSKGKGGNRDSKNVTAESDLTLLRQACFNLLRALL